MAGTDYTEQRGRRTHYVVEELTSVAKLRDIFPLGEADELNWCFLSTSGVHGDSTTLEALERFAVRPGGVDPDDGPLTVTVLVVQPRLVRSLYGQLVVGPEDITFLRGLVQSTLVAVAKSQAGNL